MKYMAKKYIAINVNRKLDANVLNKHSMAAHHTLNNGRTLPLPYWVLFIVRAS
jgi:hypothetical protein